MYLSFIECLAIVAIYTRRFRHADLSRSFPASAVVRVSASLIASGPLAFLEPAPFPACDLAGPVAPISRSNVALPALPNVSRSQS